jgi:hypothetical protein
VFEAQLSKLIMNSVVKVPDLTIVVNTCDSYNDVLDIFYHAFKAHWPDCPYSVVINTELNTYSYPVRVHNYINSSGIDDWGDRLRSTLNSIETEFVLMLYDDFIMDAPMCNQRLLAAIQLLQLETRAVVAYLINTSRPLQWLNADDIFIPLKDKVDYRLNSAPAIWRKKTLLDYTYPGDTPWAWEVFGTYRTWGDENLYYSLNPNQIDIYSYNHKKGGAIYRGKWVREVIEHAAKIYPLKINWSIRGFSSDTDSEKRTIMWKVRFMLTGYRMVGFKSLYLITTYLKEKLHAR